ncbi:nuclear transport factor 2 family protein [Lysobacter sp. LF1]|uniref:Nuclear transport factor 2 family protein n=1 Tax=Lysobacter stagni TaxID=3045172 RepID=A0ABT6XCF2_9GAMM|nr:nuclear transport factor 2 family protein [Lysobacter sp. LF1]MDI9237751.1 nuclear transport factor 2 family protein [Lysobacter sp. LF1]
MDRDEQQIRDLVATWMRATREGDGATVLELMTDDVVFLVAGRPPFGKAEFAQAMKQQAQSSMAFEGHSEIEEILIAGDWAFMRSHLTVRALRPGESDIVRSGHTLTVLTRDDGRWRIARDANLLVAQPEESP